MGAAIGGLLGEGAAAGDTASANESLQNGVNELLKIGVAPDMAKAIVLQQYKQAGTYTPQMEAQADKAVSAYSNLNEDQGTLGMQKSALQSIAQTGQTGMTAATQAALAKAQMLQDQDTKAKMQQIQMQNQAQGLGNSGMNQVQQMMAAQAGGNSMAQAGLDASSQAGNMAMQAKMAALQGAGQVRSQDYQALSQRAQAQDAMNRFNTQNQMAINNANTQMANQGQQYNLNQQQQASNANTQAQNQELQRQRQGELQNWQNAIGRAGMRKGAYTDQAGMFAGRAAATKNQDAEVGGLVDRGVKDYFTMGANEAGEDD